ncbi:mucin-3B [Hydra vulgaris]|uniref:mucin-3B n=1 Tax=Hydra vulgaris TaxID=6087 RepID=UPI001F5F74C9|nr:nuclear pore complex protein DDB_G0274915 isoform X1 [Hydra vulgaris]XP_047141811.1 nuclear pore complex protein DDB_G0274915 isoform X1 [Hydra vulgaris]XP_047141812.1 nuclear pore complex protein DDB_G0274915 isoform X1 [Hydra vulgaris]
MGISPIRENGPIDLAIAAKEARDSNIAIYAVSIGRKINMKYLLVITNNSNNIIKSSSFDHLLKTSLLSNLFPKCIFSSKVNTSTTLLLTNRYTTQTTKAFVSMMTTSEKTTKTSPPNLFETTNTLANNMVISSKRLSTLKRFKTISETTAYKAESFGSKAEDLPNNTTSFKMALFTNAVLYKSKEKSPKRKEITISNKIKIPATSTAEAFTSTESLVTTKKAVNKSAEKLFELTSIPPASSLSKQFTELTTGSEATSSKILTRPVKVATSTNTENISFSLVYTGSELQTPSNEPFFTTEEAVNISTQTLFESTSITVNNSTSKQFPEEPTSASEATKPAKITSLSNNENISSTLVFTGSELTTPSIEPFVTTEEAVNTRTATLFELTSIPPTSSLSKQFTELTTGSEATSSKILTRPVKVATSTNTENISFSLVYTGSELQTPYNEPFVAIEEAVNISTQTLFESTSITVNNSTSKQFPEELTTASEATRPAKITSLPNKKNISSTLVFTGSEHTTPSIEPFVTTEEAVNTSTATLFELTSIPLTSSLSKQFTELTTGSEATSSKILTRPVKVATSTNTENISFSLIYTGSELTTLFNEPFVTTEEAVNTSIPTLFVSTSVNNSTSKQFPEEPTTASEATRPAKIASLPNTEKISSTLVFTGSVLTTSSIEPVSLDLTRSQRVCNGFGSFDSCRCLFNVTSFPKLDLSKSDIESMFNGTCFDDKLLASIKYISSIMGSILLKKYNFKTCRDEIKNNIKKSGSCVDLLFDRFEECTVIINCEIKDIYEKAKQSKMFLENLVKFSEKRFDIFTGISNFIKWIGL